MWCGLDGSEKFPRQILPPKRSFLQVMFGTCRFIIQLGFDYSHGSSLNRFDFGRVSYSQWGMPYRTCIFKHWPDYRSKNWNTDLWILENDCSLWNYVIFTSSIFTSDTTDSKVTSELSAITPNCCLLNMYVNDHYSDAPSLLADTGFLCWVRSGHSFAHYPSQFTECFLENNLLTPFVIWGTEAIPCTQRC